MFTQMTRIHYCYLNKIKEMVFLCSVVVNRVATYRELDNDLLRHAQFLTLVRALFLNDL